MAFYQFALVIVLTPFVAGCCCKVSVPVKESLPVHRQVAAAIFFNDITLELRIRMLPGVSSICNIALTNVGSSVINNIADEDAGTHLAIRIAMKDDSGNYIKLTAYGSKLFDNFAGTFVPEMILEPNKSKTWEVDLAKTFAVTPREHYTIGASFFINASETKSRSQPMSGDLFVEGLDFTMQ